MTENIVRDWLEHDNSAVVDSSEVRTYLQWCINTIDYLRADIEHDNDTIAVLQQELNDAESQRDELEFEVDVLRYDIDDLTEQLAKKEV